MPAIATISNPLDVTGQVVADPALWTNCATAIADDPGIDATISILSIVAGHTDRKLAEDLVASGGGVLQVAVWASAAPAGCGIERLRMAGIPTFMGAAEAVAALAAWRRYWQTRGRRDCHPPPVQLRQWPCPAMHGRCWRRPASQSRARCWWRTAPAWRQPWPDCASPLALKIQSDDIPHKTELNLLRLGVKTRADAETAFETLMADARRHGPDAAIDGVLVQEMFGGRRELILGVRHEPLLGPAVVFGLGGIFSEVMRDISVRMAPVSAFDVAEMIAELRGGVLLGSVRGLGPARPGLLADVIQRFSILVLQQAGRLTEFEINPLILADDGQSCAAVDVLAGRRQTETLPMTSYPYFTEEHEMFREVVDRFVEAHCGREYIRARDEAREYPYQAYDKLVEQGWLGLTVPEEHGGIGADLLFRVILQEGLSRYAFDMGAVYGVTVWGIETLLRFGTPAQQAAYIPQALDGRNRFSISMSEPDAGSDLTSIGLKAVDQGDHYLLNGQKLWASAAGARDNIIILAARTSRMERDRRAGLTMFLVPNDTPGLELRRLKTLSRHMTGTYECFYTDVRLPKENVVGQVDRGLGRVLIRLPGGGADRRCLDVRRQHANRARRCH